MSKLDEFHHKLLNTIVFGYKHNRRYNRNGENEGKPHLKCIFGHTKVDYSLRSRIPAA